MPDQVTSDPTGLRSTTGYMPIEQYGLIGNMRTSALVATDGSVDFLCWPEFDSPSVFCRILDKDKGGHFTISPPEDVHLTTKQQYLPSSNILQTRFMNEDGVLNILDFFPRPLKSEVLNVRRDPNGRKMVDPHNALKKWLVRRVECIRGEVNVNVEVFPAFNYARDEHTTDITTEKDCVSGEMSQRVIFRSKDLSLELNATIDCGDEPEATCPRLVFETQAEKSTLGQGVCAKIQLKEGQGVSFVLRDHEEAKAEDERITTALVESVQKDTSSFWFNWISKSKYKGRWREIVNRSLMLLKLLTYEPTGAIVAAPTFSLPEDFGGGRNWDYRFSWVSVGIYATRCNLLTVRDPRYGTARSPSTYCYAWAIPRKPRPT